MSTEFFPISCFDGGQDSVLFRQVINQGIDARLEAFTKLDAYTENGRLVMEFHPDEIQILIRRLDELETEEADLWVSDIIQTYYGKEVA